MLFWMEEVFNQCPLYLLIFVNGISIRKLTIIIHCWPMLSNITSESKEEPAPSPPPPKKKAAFFGVIQRQDHQYVMCHVCTVPIV